VYSSAFPVCGARAIIPETKNPINVGLNGNYYLNIIENFNKMVVSYAGTFLI